MKYFLIPFLAWAVAQGSKHFFRLLGRNRRVFNQTSRSGLLLSGGMPSAHTATVVALAATIGLYDGITQAPFAISVWFALIVVYDAVMVRYSSGQQGDILNQLITEQHSRLPQVKVAHGHTAADALAGAAVGATIAVVVFFATKNL